MNKKRKIGFWLGFFRFFLRIKYRKCKFHNIEILDEPGMILSNHNSSFGPAAFSFYFPYSLKIWANYLYASSLVKCCKTVYHYRHVKQHKGKVSSWFTAVFGGPWVHWDFLASPTIPVYPDIRFGKTLKDSVTTIENNDYLVIFPENSEEGYEEQISKFELGFIFALEKLAEKGIDACVYTSSCDKKGRNALFGHKYRYSELLERFKTKEEIANFLRLEINDLTKKVNS